MQASIFLFLLILWSVQHLDLCLLTANVRQYKTVEISINDFMGLHP